MIVINYTFINVKGLINQSSTYNKTLINVLFLELYVYVYLHLYNEYNNKLLYWTLRKKKYNSLELSYSLYGY